MSKNRVLLTLMIALMVALMIALTGLSSAAHGATPPEVQLGKRLFRETRFAEFYARHSNDDVNRPLASGDPALETLETLERRLPHPLRGRSMSCAACHLSDENQMPGARLFTDFSRRSPVPDRGDGLTHTLRNSPTITATALKGLDSFLHFDGEFPTPESLARGGLLGRNAGWLKTEAGRAVQHIARVIREDEAPAWASAPAIAPYADSFLRLGLDVAKATDDEIVDFVAARIADYMRAQDFSRDGDGLYNASPYDVFLIRNGLPREPAKGETPISYMRRLAGLAATLVSPIWIDERNGRVFKDHDQEFRFGPKELEGLSVFAGRGQCVQCHAAPDFTDRLAHNIGVSQEEYDSINGFGSFAKLRIPSVGERAAEDFTRFARQPLPGQRDRVDLGAWTMLFNPLAPSAQDKLLRILGLSFELDPSRTPRDEMLVRSIAAFKTPTLRNLGLTAPYMHSGHIDSIEETVMFYIRSSHFMRRGAIRNGDPKLELVQLGPPDIESLSAFVRSLNEDLSH